MLLLRQPSEEGGRAPGAPPVACLRTGLVRGRPCVSSPSRVYLARDILVCSPAPHSICSPPSLSLLVPHASPARMLLQPVLIGSLLVAIPTDCPRIASRRPPTHAALRSVTFPRLGSSGVPPSVALALHGSYLVRCTLLLPLARPSSLTLPAPLSSAQHPYPPLHYDYMPPLSSLPSSCLCCCTSLFVCNSS